MAEEPEVKKEEVIIPPGEAVSPELAVKPAEVSAPSEEEDQELAQLQREVDAAETPKDKEAKQLKLAAAFARSRREKREAQEEARKAKEEAAYQKGRAEALALKTFEAVKPSDLPEAPGPVLPAKPSKESFKDADGYEDPDAYYEALTEWKVETALAKERHKQEQERVKQEYERNRGEAQKFIAKLHAKHPDYQEISRNMQFPDLVAGAIMQTGEVGVDVAYHLAKNPAELLRISHLPPIAQVVEIGQLAVKLSAPPVPPKTIPSAPAPITPLTPSGVVTTPSLDQLDTAEFMAMRDKQEFGTP